MMRKLLTFFFLLSCCFSFSQKPKTLTEIDSFGNNPGNLRMFVHAPFVKDTFKAPLVIVLHGCSQTAQDVAELTGWNKLAALHRFVVLYPQQKFLNNPNLCFNWFNNQDIEKDKGECESVYRMILFAKKNYSIDSNRIFITGLSAGAAMSVVMAATHPELFKCAAIFAGGAYGVATNPLKAAAGMMSPKYIPTEKLVNVVKEQNPNYGGDYPRIIIYQGLKDPVVNYRNATILVKQWTGVHKADTIADKTEKAFMNIKDIIRTEYTDEKGKPVVILYEAENLGHRLLIKPGDKDNEGGKTGLFGTDRGFHSTWYTAKEFGVINR